MVRFVDLAAIAVLLAVLHLTATGHFSISGESAAGLVKPPQATQAPVGPSHGETAFDAATPASSLSPERMARLLARRPSQYFDTARLEQGYVTTTGMQISQRATAIGALRFLTDRQKTDARTFITWDSYVIESREAGDRIDVLIPEAGAALQATIDRVEASDAAGPGQILRWEGSFRDLAGGPNSFSITQNLRDQYALGVFETPFGSFNMEAKNGMGWVVRQEEDFFESSPIAVPVSR